jgi:hypothetical protein
VSVAGDIAPGVRVEVMLAAVDFDDEPVLETDEVDDMSVAWSLAAKMETPVFSRSADEPTVSPLVGSFVCADRERFRQP